MLRCQMLCVGNFTVGGVRKMRSGKLHNNNSASLFNS
jgi:hypothetical protein